MKDHVETGHLTKYDAFNLNIDQVLDLEIWFKIHANVSNLRKRPPKPHKLLKFFIHFVTTVKTCHARKMHGKSCLCSA